MINCEFQYDFSTKQNVNDPASMQSKNENVLDKREVGRE